MKTTSISSNTKTITENRGRRFLFRDVGPQEASKIYYSLSDHTEKGNSIDTGDWYSEIREALLELFKNTVWERKI